MASEFMWGLASLKKNVAIHFLFPFCNVFSQQGSLDLGKLIGEVNSWSFALFIYS